MEGLFSWVVKGTLIVIFAPLLLCLALQGMVAVLAAILPWLIGFAVLIGAVAGISAGAVLRRRLPPPDTRRVAPESYGEPIRRPKGRGRES
jgi:hypothetical protein